MLYQRKVKTIEAEEITPEWFEILKKRGFTGINIGDYYIESLDVVWSKKSFESDFEEAT